MPDYTARVLEVSHPAPQMSSSDAAMRIVRILYLRMAVMLNSPELHCRDYSALIRKLSCNGDEHKDFSPSRRS